MFDIHIAVCTSILFSAFSRLKKLGLKSQSPFSTHRLSEVVAQICSQFAKNREQTCATQVCMTCDHFRQSMEWTFMLDNLNLGWVDLKQTQRSSFRKTESEENKETSLLLYWWSCWKYIWSKMNTITMVLLPVGQLYLVNTKNTWKQLLLIYRMNDYNFEILKIYFRSIHILSNSSSPAPKDWLLMIFPLQPAPRQ